MADQILTSFTPELVAAICDVVRDVSDHCLARELVSSEVYKQVLESSTTSVDQATRTLLTAIKDAVATNQTIFETVMEILRNVAFSTKKGRSVPKFMHEMEKQYLECVHPSRSRKRRRTYSDSTMMDQELAVHLKVSKLITNDEPETVFILSRAIVIVMFTKELVSAMSSSIATVCDQCLAKGLISYETYRRLHETTSKSKEDKAKDLLEEIDETIENDDRCFDLFLTTLNRNLPTAIGSKLVAEIIKESEKYTLVSSVNAGSPCYQASEMKDNSHDVHAKYSDSEVSTKLAEAHREKEKLEKELAMKIEENEKLEKELSIAEIHKEKNTERIKQLKEMIAKHKVDISWLEKRIMFLDMIKKRERELFQEKYGIASHPEVKESETELYETLKACNEDLKKKLENLQQEKTNIMENGKKLEKEKNDLLREKNALSRQKYSQQYEVTRMKTNNDWWHSNCIRRSWTNPCYCNVMGRGYCPRKH